MLAGIGIEPSEDVGGGVLFEFDGGDKAQQAVPVLADQRVVDLAGRSDRPAFPLGAVVTTEEIQPLFADALDARGEGEAQQMG